MTRSGPLWVSGRRGWVRLRLDAGDVLISVRVRPSRRFGTETRLSPGQARALAMALLERAPLEAARADAHASTLALTGDRALADRWVAMLYGGQAP